MTRFELPEGAREVLHIDLAQDKKTFLRVNLLSLLLTVLLAIVMAALWLLCPRGVPLAKLSAQLIVGGLGMLLYIALHEAVHGVVIYAVSGRKPQFGFGGGYAWTGLPGAYFTRRDYILIALSPVVVWGVVLAVLTAVLPALYPALCFIQLANLGGAAGDYYVTRALLALPQDTLCSDTGTAMRFYITEEDHHA